MTTIVGPTIERTIAIADDTRRKTMMHDDDPYEMLRRVIDWLRYQANSEGGFAQTIEDFLRRAERERGEDARGMWYIDEGRGRSGGTEIAVLEEGAGADGGPGLIAVFELLADAEWVVRAWNRRGTKKEPLTDETTHTSDCARHNAPAYEARPCDCGAVGRLAEAAELLAAPDTPKAGVEDVLCMAEDWLHRSSPDTRETFQVVKALRDEVARLRGSDSSPDAREDGRMVSMRWGVAQIKPSTPDGQLEHDLRIIAHHTLAGAAAELEWAEYPEIGLHDWERVCEIVEQIAWWPDTEVFAAAYARLEERAEGGDDEDNEDG